MHLSQHDLFTGLITIGIITLALFSTRLLIQTRLLAKAAARKLLHLLAITTCAFCIHFFENRLLLAYIFLASFCILLWIVPKTWLQFNNRNSYGIALFPLAFAVLLFIPLFNTKIIVYAVLILAVSDAAAGMAGSYWGKKKIVFLFEEKSCTGFTAFLCSALLLSVVYFNAFSLHGILFCVALSLFPAVTELFSYRGSDNFTVPLCTAIWLLLLLPLNTGQLQSLLLNVSLFGLLSFFAVYKKWLTVSGAVAACWVGIALYITGGYKAFMAPGIFLVSGSLLSKLNTQQKEKEGRNAVQVFANGIIGVLLMVFYCLSHEKVYLITAVISFCISMSDSCSSEIGLYCKGHTYDILSFKKMSPGLSGGISLQGTTAGLAGAIIISLAATMLYHLSFGIFCLVTVAGFTGMLTDSILGSWLQVKYRTTRNILTEENEPGAIQAKGVAWCDNNAVNLISNIIITWLFFYILKQIN